MARVVQELVLGYVPSPMPDELLYSVLARTASQNALGPPKHCMELFFGNASAIPSVDLQVGLEIYQKRLGQFSPFSDSTDIVDRFTLYPYYRPFLPIARHHRCMKILCFGRGGGLKTLMGTVANGFGAASALRFCTLCVQESFKNSGTIYWRRSHNLPSVTNCLDHAIQLSGYIKPHLSGSRQMLLLPPLVAGLDSTISTNSENSLLARLSIELMEANLPPLDTKVRTIAYQQALLARGLSTRSNAFIEDVRLFYGNFNDFEHKLRLLSSSKEPLRWLHDLIDRPERAMHPICHLLLIGFLFGSIKGFMQGIEEIASNSRLLLAIENVDADDSNKFRSLRGNHPAITDTSKSCRKAASESGLSITTVVELRRKLGIPVSERRKYIHPELADSIILGLTKGKEINIVARQHSVSIASVYRILRSNPEIGAARLERKTQQLKKVKRLSWKMLIDANGLQGLSVVRGHGPDLFAWLYRNDRDWLRQENLRCQSIQKKRAVRIDWASRDLLLANSVVALVVELRKKAKRRRISKSLILRTLDCEALLRRFSAKLPRLGDALDLYSEKACEFKKYRVELAIDELLITYPFPLMWRIKRHARIRTWNEEIIAHAISYREKAVAARLAISHFN